MLNVFVTVNGMYQQHDSAQLVAWTSNKDLQACQTQSVLAGNFEIARQFQMAT